MKKQIKAERKAARKREEIAQANKVLSLNDAMKVRNIDYIAVLDFEAQCRDDGVKWDVQEIIEFPTVFVSTETCKVEFTFHTYVKPDVNPQLTAFCTELTGIEQETVDAGVSLQEALNSHKAFLNDHGLVPAFSASSSKEGKDKLSQKKTFIYATCGDWDLATCLPKQLRYHNTAIPAHFRSWCNLKLGFRDFYKIKPKGMAHMLKHVGLELEGRHHSGIDDCKNLARIVGKMLKEGWQPGITETTLR